MHVGPRGRDDHITQRHQRRDGFQIHKRIDMSRDQVRVEVLTLLVLLLAVLQIDKFSIGDIKQRAQGFQSDRLVLTNCRGGTRPRQANHTLPIQFKFVAPMLHTVGISLDVTHAAVRLDVTDTTDKVPTQ